MCALSLGGEGLLQICVSNLGLSVSLFSGHPERSRNAVESKDLKNDLTESQNGARDPSTPLRSAQDDRFRETDKQQFESFTAIP